MKPEDRIVAYLFTHKSRVEYSTLDAVVTDVKLSLFFGMSPLSDDEIRKVVSQWASVYAVGLLIGPPSVSGGQPGPGAPPPTSDGELIETFKKAISTINKGVTIGKKGGNVNVGVSGLTANLKSGPNAASLSISWTGTLKLDAESGPFHFSGSLSKDTWGITVSFPQGTYIPNLPLLGKVVTEGEKALGGMADATRSFNNIGDVSKVGALIKPHMTALQQAATAVRGIQKASGGPSFGFKFGNPTPGPGDQRTPSGVQGLVVLTFVL